MDSITTFKECCVLAALVNIVVNIFIFLKLKKLLVMDTLGTTFSLSKKNMSLVPGVHYQEHISDANY